MHLPLITAHTKAAKPRINRIEFVLVNQMLHTARRAKARGCADHPRQVRRCALRLRINRRCRYAYDFGDRWPHQLRLERLLPLEGARRSPSGTGGARAAPPEDCGRPRLFSR